MYYCLEKTRKEAPIYHVDTYDSSPSVAPSDDPLQTEHPGQINPRPLLFIVPQQFYLPL